MKPLLLHGHERSITQIKYNREGDLLFSSAKDKRPTVWFSINGERLGTYDGHGGAVYCLDPSWDSKYLITGSGDNSARIWDIETGKELVIYDTGSAVRACGFSYSGKKVFYSTDKTMGQTCEIKLYDVRDSISQGTPTPYLVIPVPDSKVTSAVWGPLDEFIITGHENGTVSKWCAQTGDLIKSMRAHIDKVSDLQKSSNEMMFITASKDNTSKLFDTETMQLLKTYKTDRPVNSAAISPIRDQVVLGGGQEAMEVTTTSTRIGKFDARFFHMIFEEEIGRVKGHFGPINSLAFHPNGKSYSSGGEDGYVRSHVFDKSYYEFEFEY
ncbi:eukaryotic translation initiation factor 3 subunit I isoform X1 [Hydra vulgaris]|uniref:Eukaryotic translation initiation factor 3 subunit I n=1 Tax=Hydra vulgaris TaxID=6087 RepID=T2ME18_HYDVU|nr:eukaryotic translation initiation factor 3 subunit I [Hydra vulgaris]